MAEASFDRVRKAFQKFVATAQQTTGSIEERGAVKSRIWPEHASARVCHAALHLKLYCTVLHCTNLPLY